MNDRVVAVVVGGLLCAGTLLLARVTIVRPAEQAVVATVVDEDINDGGGALRQRATVTGGWRASSRGLTLDPGGRGTVLLTLERSPASRLVLILWMYRPTGGVTTVDCGADGTPAHALATNRQLISSLVELDDCPAADGRTWIRIKSESTSSARSGGLVLDRIQVISHQRLWLPPDILPMLMAVGTALLAWSLGALLSVPRWAAATVGVGLGGLLATVPALGTSVRLPWSAESIPVIWLALGGAMLMSRLTLRRRETREGGTSAALWLFWLMGTGLLFRWDALQLAVFRPLDPDSQMVVALARQMSSPFDTDFREPLWVWLVAGLDAFLGQSEVAIRLFSLLSSIGLLVATWLLINGRFATRAVGLLAVALLVRHPYLIESSTRGLRTELYAGLLVLITYFAVVPRLSTRLRAAGLVLAAPLIALTQLNSVLVVLPMVAFAWWRHRLPWQVPAITLLAVVAAVTPHLLNNERTHGDPLWSLNVHAVWYRNYEFIHLKKVGCDGCPAPEVHATDSYAGEPITMLEYIFGMHSPAEVATRTATGLRWLVLSRRTPATLVLGFDQRALLAVYAIGLVVLLVRRPELVIVPLAAVNLMAFIIPIGADSRLVMQCAPFFAAATAVPLVMAARVIQQRRVAAAWEVLR